MENAYHPYMIQRCADTNFSEIYEIINDAAQKYRGVIPADRYHIPYMTEKELRQEINDGVEFWGYVENGKFAGVMGIQDVDDVTLIRHAYTHSDYQRRGIGTKLLIYLLDLADKPVLIGTWAAAEWAITFYEKNGFIRVSEKEKNRLLKRYWNIPERQVETSVVLKQRRAASAE